MKKILFLVVITMFAFACKQKPEGFVLSGKIEGMKNEKVKLQKQNKDGKLIVLDSTTIKADGTFTLKGKVATPEMYFMLIDGFQGFIPIFMENAEMELSAKKDSLPKVKISGSETHAKLDDFVNLNKKYDNQTRDMTMRYQQAQMQKDSLKMESINAEFEKLEKEMIDNAVVWIKANSSSVVAMFLAHQMAPRLKFEQLQEISKSFTSDEVKKSTYGELFFEMLSDMEKVSIGKQAPEITLLNPEKQRLSLSQYKGKYVLIDFWASWCRPCMVDLPGVIEMYKKYKGKNFEIFGVSLDHDLEAWKKAITGFKIPWPLVHDINGENAKKYGVQTIPHTVLIDKEGKIIAKDLRGADLDAKLKEILK